MANMPLLISVGAIAVGALGFWVSSQLTTGTLKQSGDLRLTGRFVSEVRYAIPYATEPHLSFEGYVDLSSLEQEPTGFTARYGSVVSDLRGTRWTAVGVPDKELDPRSFLQRLSVVEAAFAIVGFVGSLASIYSVWRS